MNPPNPPRAPDAERTASDAPSTARNAIKRLQRFPLGRDLQLHENGPLNDVFPVAWAIGMVGTDAPGPRERIAVVVDEDTGGNGLRWYALIPHLLGANRSSRVVQVVARYRRDRERRTEPALSVVKPPTLAIGSVAQIDASVQPPTTIVFADSDRGSGALLRELTDPRVARWLAGGTEIVMVGDSDIALLYMMNAIADLGGETGLLYPRERRYFGGGASTIGRNFAFRLLRAPQALPGCGAIAVRMSAHLDVILETLAAGEVAAENAAMHFGISAPGRSLDTPSGSFMMLPLRYLYTDLRVDRNDGGPKTAVGHFDDLASGVAVPEARKPDVELLKRHDGDAWLERYRLALVMYRDFVSPTLTTVFGSYEVDDHGELSVREPGPELAGLLDESTWPRGEAQAPIQVGVAPVLELVAEVVAEPPAVIDAQPPSRADVDHVAGDGAKGVAEAEAKSDTKTVPVPEPAFDGAGPAANESDSFAEVLEVAPALRSEPPTVVLATDASRAALVETIRDLQVRLRAALEERDDARRALQALQPPAPVVPYGVATVLPAAVPAQPGRPSSWDDLFIWAHQAWPTAIAFTSRARRAARKSVFRDVAHAAEAIELLAREYRNVRVLGDATARQAFDERLRETGFSVGPTGAAVTAHQTAELYTATWEGKRYRLDTHLQGSSARDKARGLRVYFAWLPERAMLLVGHLPTHLRNSLD